MSGPRRLGRLLRIGSVRKDLEEELAFHFAEAEAELVGQGLSVQQAREEAERRFGDVRRYRRELEGIDRRRAAQRRWRERAETGASMVALAVRSLVRAPLLTAGIVLAFALGIGANATMFGIVERLLLRAPEHILAPEQVKRLYVESYVDYMGSRFMTETVTWPDYMQLKNATSFAALAAFATRPMTVGSGLAAEPARAVWASASFFPLLGVQPVFGRFYDAAEDRSGGARVAVISHGYWQRAYGGSADVLGRTIDLGHGAYTIIGVTPRGFTGVDLAPVDFFLPIEGVADAQGDGWREDSGWYWFSMVGRLAPAATTARAEAEASALHLAQRAADIAAEEYNRDPRIVAGPVIAARRPATGTAVGGMVIASDAMESVVARLLFAVAAVVLLIACVNIANLLLARILLQRREVAVRLALGISRRRLIGQILLEGVLLALLGGAAALAVAQWGGSVVRRVLLPDIAWDQFDTGGRVLLFVLAISILAGLLSALVPAFQAARGDLASSLRQAGAGGLTRGSARLRTGLALVQTALSVVLLVGAGLFVRSLERVRTADLGFDADRLLYVSPRAQRDALDDRDRARIFAQAEERIARLPGVQHAGASTTLPFLSSAARRISAAGMDSLPRLPTGGPYIHEVSGDYFAAMGLEVRVGRTFTAADAVGTPPVVLVNETMARQLWPGRSPLGECLRIGGEDREHNRTRPCSTVVGVVEDARRQSVRAEETFQYYIPLAQRHLDSIPEYLVVRVARETPALLNAIRRQVLGLDPAIRWVDVSRLQDRIAPETRAWQLGATLFSLFGLLALVVAAIGLYSMLAFDVAQRTRELAVRTALGATTRRLVRHILHRALATTALGVAAGVLVALLLAGRVEPLLFETRGRDPLSFAGVALVLLAVAVAAAGLPAWRAARVDPGTALRSD